MPRYIERSVLYINDEPHELASLEDMTRHLDSARRREYADLLVMTGDDGLTKLLTNRDRGRAYLSFWSGRHPIGFHAVSGGSGQGAEVEFVLSNGQEDAWELGETVALVDGLRAVKYAFVYGERAPFVLWHDDAPGAV